MSDYSGYSWIFSAPKDVLTQGPLLFRVNGAVFLTYRTVLSTDGDTFQGYVQWLTRLTIEDLRRRYPLYTWMKSVNDPLVYGIFLTPGAEVYGNPRVNIPKPKNILRGLKKKLKGAISIKLREEMLKASIEFLKDYQ